MTDPTKEEANKPPTKEKLRSIMEAASALTALGDEESDAEEHSKEEPPGATAKPDAPGTETPKKEEKSDATSEPPSTLTKRYLPEHKKPDAAPTFPEKLMSMMRYAEEKGQGNEDFCIAWLPEGKSFVIRNPDEFTRHIVPKFFKPTKFSSFTRKLYRWGFRQINRGIGPDDPIIFGNEFFLRDDADVMSKMRSITAAGTRKQEQTHGMSYGKRPFDGMYGETPDQKRFIFDHFMQQKSAMMQQNPSLYGMNPNGPMQLSTALRPGIGMESPQHCMAKPYDMVHQQHPHMQQQPSQTHMMHYNMPPHQPHMQHHSQQGTPQQPPQQQAHQGQSGGSGGNGQYPNPQSTADIVNAAIAALRYAN